MTTQATHTKLRIFVACPQDVLAERDKIRAVANELNKTIADAVGVVLEVVDWTTHVLPTMGRAQQVTFDRIPVDTWDVFIGMLWLRFGTPSGGINPTSSAHFNSGTEEEFTAAYDLWKKNGTPRILFFRCTRAAPPNLIDPEQIQKINSFFSNFAASGSHPGLVRNYETIESFEKSVFTDLTRVLLEFSRHNNLKKIAESSSDDLGVLHLPVNKGFLGFFTPDTNDERNQRKKKSLLHETQLIRLLAHVGHSYIAKVGNRFEDEITGCLDAGAHFRVMILNPWTETGLLIAIGEADQKVEGIDFDNSKVDFSQLDVVSVIEESTYYKYSLLQVFDEYKVLRKEFGERIELRLTTHDIPATILLTNTTGFFEPYISVNLQQRLRKALHTFEIQYSSDSYFYKNTSTYFDTLWKMSEPYYDFQKKQEYFKKRLQTLYSHQDNAS